MEHERALKVSPKEYCGGRAFQAILRARVLPATLCERSLPVLGSVGFRPFEFGIVLAHHATSIGDEVGAPFDR